MGFFSLFFSGCDEFSDSFISFTAVYSLSLSLCQGAEGGPAYSGQTRRKTVFVASGRHMGPRVRISGARSKAQNF